VACTEAGRQFRDSVQARRLPETFSGPDITLNTTADILCGRSIALNGQSRWMTNRISNNNSLQTSAAAAPTSAATAQRGPLRLMTATILCLFRCQAPLLLLSPDGECGLPLEGRFFPNLDSIIER